MEKEQKKENSKKGKKDNIEKTSVKSMKTVIEKKQEDNIQVNNDIFSQNNDLKSRIYVGYYTRFLINCLLFVFAFFLFIICFVSGIKFKVNYNLNYSIKPGIDYQVYLKDNDYYKEKSLKEDMQYITDLIDYIDVNFNYNTNTNENSNYEFKYNIKADIVVTDRNDNNKVLYTDSEIIKDETILKEDNKDKVSLSENLKLDYAKYSRLVSSFKSKYVLSASSNLIVTMHVDTIIKNSNVDDDIVNSEDLKLTIPLSEQTINILKDYNKEGRTGTVSKYSYIKIENIYFAIASLLFAILVLISIINLLRFINKSSRPNSLYNKKLHKIMKEYDRIIVSLSKLPDLSQYKIIEVESFEELLDAKENLDKPILHIEIHKNQKSYFIIISNKEAYRYVLKEVDLQNEKKN